MSAIAKAKYDKHYRGENYFGRSYPALTKFFKEHEPKGLVLDIGCGQGRDALMLARLGYSVRGVDLSRIGINQMLEQAKSEGLDVRGDVADASTYPITSDVDIILLDSFFHFYSRDKVYETGILKRFAKELRGGGIICNCMTKNPTAVRHLKKILYRISSEGAVLYDGLINYPEFDAQFHMYIVRKKESS